MKRYIDADKLKESFSNSVNSAYDMLPIDCICDVIDEFDESDAKEVIHGKWAKDAEYPLTDVRCSTCSIRVSKCLSTYFIFCPNCGATMDGGSK